MEKAQDTGKLHYQYRFEFEQAPALDFDIVLDAHSLELVEMDHTPRPEWTKLDFCQCENCPLPKEVQYCPVAVNLSRLVDTFRSSVSFESTSVTVKTPERTYVKKTTLQKGIASIIGITMTTSNCPVMDKLRPMARFHLPFATSIETFYRSVSAYLTAQFLLARKGEVPDWTLERLLGYYKAINIVNKGMSNRLSKATESDANVNAVVILHSFGDGISYFIQDGLEEIEPMFSVYFNGKEKQGELTAPQTNTSHGSSS
ncbi:MAG TPA: hypothetical protein VMM37_04340 [Bacteroidota bacterium]|nr:hypothetical protein [Bacteroidota bacterium]